MSKNSRFRKPFDSQHAKWSQKLLKSAYNTFIIFLITLTKIELENVSVSDLGTIS